MPLLEVHAVHGPGLPAVDVRPGRPWATRWASNWDTVEKYLRPISIIVTVLIAAGIVWWVRRRIVERRREAERAQTG